MFVYYLTLTDDCIYWKLTGVDEQFEDIFTEPVVIKCRWDTVTEEIQKDDTVQTNAKQNTVFPDRVLVVGSFVMLGTEETLQGLTPDEKANPNLLKNAKRIVSQSTIAELGWEQKQYPPDFMSERVVIQCQI